MDRQSVPSREIAIIGYEAETQTLEVTFRKGGVYHYFKVPSEVHESLMKASSIGTFFAEEVKDRYSYQKIS